MPHLEALFDDENEWIRATSRIMVGHCMLNVGEQTAGAAAVMRAALDIFRRLGDRWGVSMALSALSELLSRDGDHATAAAMMVEAIEALATLGTREDLPMLVVKQASEHWLAGDAERAAALLDEADVLATAVGLPEALAGVAHARGEQARLRGDLPAAYAHLARAEGLLSTASVAGAPQFASMVATSLGYLAAAMGDLPAARGRHDTALRKAVESMDAPVIGQAVVGLADLRLAEGDPAGAAELLGTAVGIRGAADRSLPDLPRVEAAARAGLGGAAFDEAFARGRGRTAPDQLLRHLGGTAN
jgi:tetratricopeptide (TPR) repeat protein